MSLSCFGRVAPGEIPERLAGVAPRREVPAEHPLDDGGGVVRLHVAIDLAADVLIGAVAPAEEEVVAFHHVIVVVDRDLGAEQADVADVVLRARVRAAGHVDVERHVEFEPGVEVVGDGQGMPLRVGGGELAAEVPRAGDEAGADLRRLPGEAQGLDLAA